MKVFIFCALALSVTAVTASDCDIDLGKKVFANKCSICHVSEPGAVHTVGPNLTSVVGREIGKAKGYLYSEALANVGGTWDAGRLNEFLKSPAKAIPGTAMPFQGLKSDVERHNLICFIQTQ